MRVPKAIGDRDMLKSAPAATSAAQPRRTPRRERRIWRAQEGDG
jgi:hypothetical protein